MTPSSDLHLVEPPPDRPRRDAAIVLALIAGATAINLALDGRARLTSQAMLYVLAVVLAAYTVSRTAALLGAIGAALCLNFFFIEPRYTLQVDAQENVSALVAMLGVALVISHLADASRRDAEAARRSERRARQLQELAAELADASSAADVHVLAQRYLARAFPGPCLVALLSPEGKLQLPEDHRTLRDGMLACIREAAVLGPGTGRWPGLGAWYLPLASERHIAGAACVQDVRARDVAGLDHAQAIAALAGQALWRMKLAASVHEAEEQSQWHKAQNTFLAAISHDFRTPLASIMAAATSLEMQRHKLPPSEQERLLGTIVGETTHLVRLTDNTLQLVRLENAGELVLDWQSVEEIVGAVLARVRARDVSRRIHSQVDTGLPLIRADSVLLAQLLENLLDNALKYSADAIELTASQRGGHIDIAVDDRGDGIAAGEELVIFEPFRRGDRAGPRGTGLGLAVCRAIARAHGGELARVPRSGGGSSFVLRLPVEAVQPVPEAA
ncbi:sensor histidine kinase [Ramlibacter sp. MMS24-I3-19]|uniref:sensor histidine kinase n=1 Tax=Ramlibacter sp. MMS24-I3-19 TaxID=3416606 RepID=UPI003CFC3348